MSDSDRKFDNNNSRLSKLSSHHSTTVPSEEYTQEYYESCCQGYEEFKSSHGEVIPLRLYIPLKLANIKAGMNVVDIGCGRGEMILQCALRGANIWGLDYANAALALAHDAISNEKYAEFRNSMAIQRSISSYLPFASESIDLVFMLDIVEHLYPDELKATFSEVVRILHPNGRLIVHTMPNLMYYRYGYPLYRFIQRLRGQQLPVDPRARWKYAHVHVNEQTPGKLRKALQQSRLQTKTWLYPAQSYQYENNLIVRFGMKFLTHIYPFRWIFCNDIFAIGTKR